MSLLRVTTGRVSIGPPDDAALAWIQASLSDPAVARALGWPGRVGAEVYGGYIEGTALLLPYADGAGDRVGFVLLMRPDTATRVWSVHVVVPDPRRRNGFTTLAALDALCHLVFDQRGDQGLEWRIEPGNGASSVLPRRLGYRRRGEVLEAGTRFDVYGIGPADWNDRRRRLRDRFIAERVPFEHVAHGRVMAAVRFARSAPPR